MASPEPLAELIKRAVAALNQQAWSEAEEIARAVLSRFGPEANALMILASIRAEAGDSESAIDLYEQARAVMPTHIHVLVNLASLYRASGRFEDARRSLDAALRVDPRFAVAHHNLGNVYLDLGERSHAQQSYERASSLDPRYPDPIAGLASIAEEEHRLDDARTLAERALQLAPQHTLAGLTLGRVKVRQDDALGAIRVLEPLLRRGGLSVTNRILAQGVLGDAYDKLARYDEAFAAFTEANALQHEQCGVAIAREHGPLTPASVARLTTYVAGVELAGWRPAPPSSPTPVFLVGFPRSGTTLLDQILASHPEVTTLEERDTLLEAASELIIVDEQHRRWATLSDTEIEGLRERYWQRVRAGGAVAQQYRVFIDKQPLNAVLLPLIYRLFPGARVILAIRDPRDVVISCYQQRFGMNAAMYQLLRLDTAAAYYDAVMRLVEVCRAKLPLQIHVVRYEDVITHFERTVSHALAFLELDWSEGVRRHTETAKKRTINTPSAAQVVRPLYGSARGRWRNYAGYLKPYFPVLMPWVQALGYDP